MKVTNRYGLDSISACHFPCYYCGHFHASIFGVIRVLFPAHLIDVIKDSFVCHADFIFAPNTCRQLSATGVDDPHRVPAIR
ncbi:MAG: hypothetical protein RRB22_14720 [Gammaproteobacteria bacterium]|nr:hypothetical protein [Gammaproteobacteria bacterium]